MDLIINNLDKRGTMDGEKVSNLVLTASSTRHGICFRLNRVLTVVDSTYRFEEIFQMIKHYNSIIKIWKTNFTDNQWNELKLHSNN